MNAKVISPFTDAEKGGVYLPGDTFSGTAARIGFLAEKGFVEKPKRAGREKAQQGK